MVSEPGGRGEVAAPAPSPRTQRLLSGVARTRTSCLQIADHQALGVSSVLDPRSLSGSVLSSLDCVTGTPVARQRRFSACNL